MANESLENLFQLDFVGIGAPKCATTWIYECLQEHPEIRLAPKDQERFAFFFQGRVTKDYIKKYKYFFNNNKVKGDFHANYLYYPEVIKRIRKHNPNIKILLCLRNPVERAYSEYRYFQYKEGDNADSFEEAATKRKEILERGFYYKYLNNYFEEFSEDNIFVLILEEIKDKPLKFIQKIYEFLGVDKDFEPPSINTKLNLTQFKMTKLGRLIHKSIITPILRRTKWGWKLKRSVFIKRVLGKFSEFYVKDKKNEKLDYRDQKRIKKIYQKDVRKLEQLINKDLNYWK